MTEAWQSEINALLLKCRIGSLATIGKNGPEASMAPYAIDRGDIVLHLSTLARHTGNIADHPDVGFMICMPETTADSPLALPRLTLQGKATAVAADAYEAVKATYLRSIPAAEPLFQFSDFRLFRVTPSTIHWVGGFASARTLSLRDWRALLAKQE